MTWRKEEGGILLHLPTGGYRPTTVPPTEAFRLRRPAGWRRYYAACIPVCFIHYYHTTLRLHTEECLRYDTIHLLYIHWRRWPQEAHLTLPAHYLWRLPVAVCRRPLQRPAWPFLLAWRKALLLTHRLYCWRGGCCDSVDCLREEAAFSHCTTPACRGALSLCLWVTSTCSDPTQALSCRLSARAGGGGCWRPGGSQAAGLRWLLEAGDTRREAWHSVHLSLLFCLCLYADWWKCSEQYSLTLCVVDGEADQKFWRWLRLSLSVLGEALLWLLPFPTWSILTRGGGELLKRLPFSSVQRKASASSAVRPGGPGRLTRGSEENACCPDRECPGRRLLPPSGGGGGCLCLSERRAYWPGEKPVSQCRADRLCMLMAAHIPIHSYRWAPSPMNPLLLPVWEDGRPEEGLLTTPLFSAFPGGEAIWPYCLGGGCLFGTHFGVHCPQASPSAAHCDSLCGALQEREATAGGLPWERWRWLGGGGCSFVSLHTCLWAGGLGLTAAEPCPSCSLEEPASSDEEADSEKPEEEPLWRLEAFLCWRRWRLEEGLTLPGGPSAVLWPVTREPQDYTEAQKFSKQKWRRRLYETREILMKNSQ